MGSCGGGGEINHDEGGVFYTNPSLSAFLDLCTESSLHEN